MSTELYERTDNRPYFVVAFNVDGSKKEEPSVVTQYENATLAFDECERLAQEQQIDLLERRTSGEDQSRIKEYRFYTVFDYGGPLEHMLGNRSEGLF